MKKVVALVGSPRRMGNCEILVKEISRHIELPHELRLVRLSDFEIRPCRGCYACLFGDAGCPIADDFNTVLAEILAADAYIVASPTYFLGPTSVLKAFTDRSLALLSHAEKLWGRPGVAFGVAGIEGRQGYTELGLESFLKVLLADLKGVRMFFGALPGEVLYRDENRDVARQLASALFGERITPGAPSCPVCGGTTFRFLEGGGIRCMLCSNSGSYAADGAVSFRIGTGEHEFFTSLEAAVAHREWLKGMKGRFLEEKARLKQVTVPYLNQGITVRPEGKDR